MLCSACTLLTHIHGFLCFSATSVYTQPVCSVCISCETCTEQKVSRGLIGIGHTYTLIVMELLLTKHLQTLGTQFGLALYHIASGFTAWIHRLYVCVNIQCHTCSEWEGETLTGVGRPKQAHRDESLFQFAAGCLLQLHLLYSHSCALFQLWHSLPHFLQWGISRSQLGIC